MMRIKEYRTLNGARGFMRQLQAKWPHKLFRIDSKIAPDFRERYHVAVMIEQADRVLWVGCGPISKGG